MRALTVQQPWAWAIVHGGKDVENRTQAWSYRGPLAIHAGMQLSERGMESPLLLAAAGLKQTRDPAARSIRLGWRPAEAGRFLGVVDLVDVHVAWLASETNRCCESPWGEFAEGPTKPVVHLVLENPRPLEVPIPCKGRLGLWTPPAAVLDQLQAVTA